MGNVAALRFGVAPLLAAVGLGYGLGAAHVAAALPSPATLVLLGFAVVSSAANITFYARRESLSYSAYEAVAVVALLTDPDPWAAAAATIGVLLVGALFAEPGVGLHGPGVPLRWAKPTINFGARAVSVAAASSVVALARPEGLWATAVVPVGALVAANVATSVVLFGVLRVLDPTTPLRRYARDYVDMVAVLGRIDVCLVALLVVVAPYGLGPAVVVAVAAFWGLNAYRDLHDARRDLDLLHDLLAATRKTYEHDTLGEIGEELAGLVTDLFRAESTRFVFTEPEQVPGRICKQLTDDVWLVMDGGGNSRGWTDERLGWFDDIAETLGPAVGAMRRRSQMRAAAERDDLTGLANRRALLATLEQYLADGRELSVAFCDLNDFKPVNDTYGHAAGNHVLVELGRRLVGFCRSGDVAARLGGDEFCLVLSGAGPATDLDGVRDRLLQVVEQPVTLPSGDVVSVGSAVGIVVARVGESAEAVVRRADEAMYADKQARQLGR